jgi:hypothetical protein
MVFRFVQNVFFGQHTRVRIFIFFDENLTLGYMTKTLNQIFFSFPPLYFSRMNVL